MKTDLWPTLRAAYIYGRSNSEGQIEYPTHADLASQAGLSLSALTHRAASEQWQRQRQQAQDRVIEKAFETYENEMAAILARLDRQVARVSLKMLDVIEEALQNAESPEQRQALVNRYSKQLPDLIQAAHSAIGVERVLERAYAVIEGQENGKK